MYFYLMIRTGLQWMTSQQNHHVANFKFCEWKQTNFGNVFIHLSLRYGQYKKEHEYMSSVLHVLKKSEFYY